MRAYVFVLLCGVLLATACARGALSGTPAPAPTALPVPMGNHPLYVVDTNNGDLVTHVLLVDGDAQRLTMTLTTRYTPEIAFSPDGCTSHTELTEATTCAGGWLYVADSYRTRVTTGENHDVVTVYDATTGAVVKDETDIAGRLLYKVFPIAHPFTFLSGDGKYLVVGKYGNPDVHDLRMAVLDATTFKPVAEYPHPCGGAVLLPMKDGRLFCANGTTVQVLTGTVKSLGLSLPAINAPVLSDDSSRVYLVSSDARTGANVTVVSLTGTPAILTDRVSLRLVPDARASLLQVALSPDQARLYVGVITGRHGYDGLPDDIVAFDTATWEAVGVIQPHDPPFHFALSADGTQLYTVSPTADSLTIFDTSTFRERGLMQRLGNTPAHILVPHSR